MFAGEDRTYVEEIVAPLKAAGIRVFYDSDYLAETWGENLVEYFDGVYRKRSRFAMLFVSQHYAEKMWPRLERRSALARAMEEKAAYVLPVRLDDSEIDGLLPTVGIVDARRLGIDKIVEAALRKFSGHPVSGPSAVTHAPRSEPERQLLLIDKPDGWEYLYFASELLRLRESVEEKYRDYMVRAGAKTGPRVRDEDIPHFLQTATGNASRLAGSLDHVMGAEAQERAFGAPGHPGDPAWIEHLAKSWNGVYEGFLDWAAECAGQVWATPGTTSSMRSLTTLINRSVPTALS